MNARTFLKLGGLAGIAAMLCQRARGAVAIPIHTTFAQIRITDAAGITSNATLANDSVLTLPIAANARMTLQAWIPFSLGGGVSGYQFGVSLPTSPTNVILAGEVVNAVTGALALSALATAGGLVVGGALATSGTHFAKITGTIENGSTAGSVIIQAAQNVSNGSALTILRGASLILTPMGP